MSEKDNFPNKIIHLQDKNDEGRKGQEKTKRSSFSTIKPLARVTHIALHKPQGKMETS